MNIPFNKRYRSENEIEYIKDALNRAEVGGDGRYTQWVASFIQQKFNIGRVLPVTSATHALEMACMLIDLKAGDEVIMPSFAFPSISNAVILRGAKPVFAEIESSTLNIDPKDIEHRITGKTKAIIVVHYGGMGCKMDEILSIASGKGLYVIEDAAQAVNAKYRGKYLGSWGDLGCYSFHSTKNVTSGEGGALLINSEDGRIMENAEIIRQKGTNRNQFLRGEIDKYCWVGMGSSYSPSDILMALLYSQIIDMDEITTRRQRIFNFYSEELKKFTENGTLKTIQIPEDCQPNYHLFYILFESESIRDWVMGKLNERGIQAVIHFMPLHSSPMGIRLGYRNDDFPITEAVSRCLLRLPLYTDMTGNEIKYVVDHLKEIVEAL